MPVQKSELKSVHESTFTDITDSDGFTSVRKASGRAHQDVDEALSSGGGGSSGSGGRSTGCLDRCVATRVAKSRPLRAWCWLLVADASGEEEAWPR